MVFKDRADAGRELAKSLALLKNESNLIVLGIPRGGVVVAAQVARTLHAPLDIFFAHKLGAPSNPELAIGAIAGGGAILLDDVVVRDLQISEKDIAREAELQRKEIARRAKLYRQGRPPLNVKNKTVVLIDDGVATGSTVLVSLRALRQQLPTELVLAVPVGPVDTLARLARECDQLVVIERPAVFWAVGQFYLNFGQTSDEEVIALLS
jgi:putative phosphoribosyl transferase